MIPWYGLLIVFPLFCAFVGWVTNIIAVNMIFYPVAPRRVLGLRFQGVLPKHKEHFAREMAEVVTSDFMTTGEMVQRLDAEALYQAVRPVLLRALDRVLDDLRELLPEAKRPLLSESVVQGARQQVERELRRRLPELVSGIGGRADALVDLNDLITDKLLAIATDRFVELVASLGKRELTYIKVYGALFGLIIGLVQFTVSTVFSFRLTLILVGVLVGAVTNYLAIQMLFFPRQPRRILFFRVQGLFPKRQEEIAGELARVAARDFIVPREVLGRLAGQTLPSRVSEEQVAAAERAFFARFPQLQALHDALLDEPGRRALRRKLVQRYGEVVPEVVDAALHEAEDQLDIGAILRQKVLALSKLRFESFTRGLFQQEEVYLVIYGGLMGGMLGGVQLSLLLLKHWI